nr:hypothetical protein CPGR_02612 [Mycolicibacterium malmesburyense]
MAQYRGFQVSQRRSGVDAEFVGEALAHRCTDREGIGLPARTVQREHEHAVKRFPIRMGSRQPFEFGDDAVVPAEHEIGIDAEFRCVQPKFVKASCFSGGEAGFIKVLEHASTPQA